MSRMKMQGKWWIAALILSIGTFGCFEESELEKLQKESDQKIDAYLEANNIEPMVSPYGLKYEKLEENNDGDLPSSGDVLSVKYTIKTLEGTLISSLDGDSTLFRFGSSRVVPYGVNYGMDVTKTGEKVRFYLPQYMAYQNFYPADGTFEPFENFIVEMELIKLFTESEVNEIENGLIMDYITQNQVEDLTTTATGLHFKTLEAGEGNVVQAYNSVTFHYTRKYLDGTVIQTTTTGNPVTAIVGSELLVEGLNEGILKMKAGEKALLIMPSDLAFGSSTSIFPEVLRAEMYDDGIVNNLVAPYSPVMYEVELLEIN